MGELFDHGCDNLGAVFQVLTLVKVMGWTDPATQWYLVQATQLLFLSQHVSPYNAKDKTIRFGLFSGPGEILHLTVYTMLVNALWGQQYIFDLFVVVLRQVDHRVASLGPSPPPVEKRDVGRGEP